MCDNLNMFCIDVLFLVEDYHWFDQYFELAKLSIYCVNMITVILIYIMNTLM